MRRFAILFAASLLSACSADLKEGQFACGLMGQCPGGWYCREGFCYSTPGVGGMDAGPGFDAGPDFDGGPDYDAGSRPDTGVPAEVDSGVIPGVDAGPCTCPDEGNLCTTDACVGDVCTHTPVVCGPMEMCNPGMGDCICRAGLTLCGACVDTMSDNLNCGSCGMVCTGGTTCISGTCGTCSPSDPCADTNPCTDDSCSAAMCIHVNNTASCDDGNPCTVTDRCSAGTCAGTPMNCDDGISCTTDSCSGGTCVHPVMGTHCLIAGACYAAGFPNPAAPMCSRCTPATSQTAFSTVPGGTACNDGNGNTCDDRCVGITCSGTSPICNDGNPCTVDTVSCGAPGNCDNSPGNDGDVCPGPSRGHCCGGSCRDFGNCCTMGGCGFGGLCPGACSSYSCCGSCGGPGPCGA